jgi:hypothetical protein
MREHMRLKYAPKADWLLRSAAAANRKAYRMIGWQGTKRETRVKREVQHAAAVHHFPETLRS